MNAGMDVARINRSHGSTEEHEAVYNNVRQAAQEAGRNVAVLVDLQGPKIRLEKFADGPHELAIGDVFTITTRDVVGTKDICGTTFKGLPGDCSVGDTLLIDDGKVRLEVTDIVDGTDVVTKVVVPGPVSNNKGINLPGVAVSVPALSEKDEDDLRWGLNIGADFIALSFVRSAKDYEDVARIMAEEGITLPVVAKVEKPQAVDNLEEIVDAFDGIMVARGDLGVEPSARRGAAGAEARHRVVPCLREARHRRHPGARVDDALARADPCRDLGLRERDPGRHRRGHAFGRDLGRRLPDRHRRDHGPHRAQHGGEGVLAYRAVPHHPQDARWRRHARGGRDRQRARHQVHRDVHPVG
ncbi:hypothetical protein GCM10025876_36580 [Demequina litorisediminis]|uniref:Pyruvate kinase n=1 Tax=Demequina litorisediminis TaxID=1849022 RepID=A0ABQ6IL95_9MICO|nr:hypothetical protein GCM10025876_36580 [Demequina litorisediminis]